MAKVMVVPSKCSTVKPSNTGIPCETYLFPILETLGEVAYWYYRECMVSTVSNPKYSLSEICVSPMGLIVESCRFPIR